MAIAAFYKLKEAEERVEKRDDELSKWVVHIPDAEMNHYIYHTTLDSEQKRQFLIDLPKKEQQEFRIL